MIISTCGFGSTGSSAVSDYLLECEGISLFDKIEFTICTQPDGIEDLEYHLMKSHSRLSSSIVAIRRFRKMVLSCSREWHKETKIKKKDIKLLTNEYLSSLIQLRFIGFPPEEKQAHFKLWRRYFGESIMLHRIIPFLEKKKIIKKNFNFYPLELVESSIEPKNFYSATKKYISSLLIKMGCDSSKTIVLDQAFSGDNPAKSFPFFDDPFGIVVDRDPRDLYIFAKEKLLSRGRFMPTDTVQNFITYYRMLRDKQPYKHPNERILFVQFEKLVYDYDNESARIDAFLNLNNTSRKSIFIPEMSAANTNLIRNFPQYQNDIEIIEKELEEYIFPFEKYKAIQNKGAMFFGKSSLNKGQPNERNKFKK